MSVVVDKVKEVIQGMGLTYLRVTSEADLNQTLTTIDTSNSLGVLGNIPSIENTIAPRTGLTLIETSIEVFFLEKNITADDKGEVIDGLLDTAEDNARKFFDIIKQDPITSPTQTIESYTLDGVDSFELTDEIVTGWKLSVTIPTDQSVYDCS